MLAFSLSSSEGSQSRVPSAASVMRSPFLSCCWYPERARSGAVHPSPTVMEAPSMNDLRRAEECHRFRDFLGFGQALDRECRKHHLLEPYVAHRANNLGSLSASGPWFQRLRQIPQGFKVPRVRPARPRRGRRRPRRRGAISPLRHGAPPPTAPSSSPPARGGAAPPRPRRPRPPAPSPPCPAWAPSGSHRPRPPRPVPPRPRRVDGV